MKILDMKSIRRFPREIKRRIFNGVTGSISAHPNPVLLSPDEFQAGATTLTWTSKGTREVEVRIGAPDGELFSRSGPDGSAVTGRWVSDFTVFFLQDVSDRKPLNANNTISKIEVKVRKLKYKLNCPGLGKVKFGNFRRLEPISRMWGFDRGQPIDRYYIESFLAGHSHEIRGHVLEIGDNTYTRKFGESRVTNSDVLNYCKGEPATTIVADLSQAPQIPSDMFDVIICTQTLQLIYDVKAAIGTLYRILKPGGILFATFPGISQTYDLGWQKNWCWSFTSLSARRIFEEFFQAHELEIQAYGNVLTAVSFMQGLASVELSREELAYHDPGYEMLITIKAVKS